MGVEEFYMGSKRTHYGVYMLYFTPGASRGDHYHPEFTEYFLVVEGFKQREKELVDKWTKFIVPLPEVRIV